MQANVIYIEDFAHPLACRRMARLRHNRRIRAVDPKWRDRPYICTVNGEPILRAGWNRRIRDNDVVVFVSLPPQVRGGGGGSSPLRIVLMVALAVAAPGLGQAFAQGITGLGGGIGAFGSTFEMGSFFSGAIGFVGKIAINALMGSPKPPSPQQMQSMSAPSPTYSLSAQGNRARLLDAIPRQYGRHLMYPDLAAEPYTEYAGEEQYLYQLFCLGLGQYSVESIRIEDTPIGNFPEVTYQIAMPGQQVTLFPTNVVTAPEVSGQEMLTNVAQGPFVANGAGTAADAIIVDVVCPKGLFYANDDGSLAPRTVSFSVEIRSIDNSGAAIGSWQAVNADQTFYYSNYWSKGYWTSTSPSSYPSLSTKTWNQTGYGTTVAGDHQDGAATGVQVQVGTGQFNLPIYANEIWRWKPFDADPHPVQTYVAAVPNISITAATNTPVRQTYKFRVAPGRYEVRATRTNAKDASSRAGNDLMWSALRANIPGSENYGDVTLLAVRMRASNSLSAQASRRVNVIQTACLPIWNGIAWLSPTPTRSIAWAAADALRAPYGGKVADSAINFTQLLALDQTWSSRGDTFDGIFDSRMALFEALSLILRAGRAKPFQQGGQWNFVRDQAQTLPAAVFGMRNIVKGSVKVQYVMPTSETADAFDVQFFNETTWTWDSVRAQLPGSLAKNPTKLKVFGVVKRGQAWQIGMYEAAANRYRRMPFSLQTEMEGYIPTFGDLVTVSHDRARWGQSGEIVGWDPATRTVIASEPLDYSAGGTHYIGLRRRDGSRSGPYVATIGTDAYHAVLATAPDFTPYTGWDEERTHYQFGPGELHSKQALVVAVKPRSATRVELALVNDDPAVHTADTSTAPPASTMWNLPAAITRPVVSAIAVGLSGIVGSPAVMVSIQAAVGADYYLAEYSYDNGASWIKLGQMAANFSFPARPGLLQVRVRGVGLAAGEWATWSGDPMAAPMPDVTNLTTIYRSGQTYLVWRGVADPRAKDYEIRFGPNWNSAQKIGSSVLLEFPTIGNGTYWVSARYGAIYSANPMSIVIAGTMLTRNVIASYDEAASGWTGTTSGGAMQQNANIILQGTGDVLSVADFMAITDFLWYGGISATGTYELPASHAVNIGRVAPCQVMIGYTATSQQIYDDYLSIQDIFSVGDLLGSLFGSKIQVVPQISLAQADGVYGAWQDFIPGAFLAQYYKARVLLISADVQVTAVLSGLTFSVDVPDRIIEGSVAVPAAGANIVYSPAFNGGALGNPVPLPQITILNALAGDDVIISNQTLSGFAVQVVNGGSGVARTINHREQGY